MTDPLTALAKSGALLTGKTEPMGCDFCGEKKELRPYGPKGENICFTCMKKNEPAAERQFEKALKTPQSGTVQ